MSVCVCALNCGGIPSPEPHHNWRFGASLICIFVCILWSLSWQFFWDFCWYAFKRWGHRIVRSLFAPHCCLWRNPFTGISLKTEVLVRYYGSSLQYAMGMNWFTSIEISMLKFGMWSSAQFATVDWQLSFNPFCGIGCDLLSTALRMGPSTGFCIIMGNGIMWSGCQEFWNKYLWVHWSVPSPLPLAHRPFHPINWERSFGCYGFRVHTCWSGGRI